MGYRDGTDLILGLMDGTTFKPFGHSTSCKISDSTETGERQTKEASSGKFKEKYVKSLSESITCDGFVFDGDEGSSSSKVSLPTLKEKWLNGQTVKARYAYRGEESTKYYQGDFIITSLEDDGPAGDDEKYSLTLENSGPITPQPSQGGGGAGNGAGNGDGDDDD